MRTMGEAPMRARLIAALLIVAALGTLAPRTSWPLGAGWRAVTHTDTFESPRGATSTLVFTAIPPQDADPQTVLTMTIVGGPWTLVAASSECHQVANKVSCVLDTQKLRRNHVLRITVRATEGDPLSWTMTAAAGA